MVRERIIMRNHSALHPYRSNKMYILALVVEEPFLIYSHLLRRMVLNIEIHSRLAWECDNQSRLDWSSVVVQDDQYVTLYAGVGRNETMRMYSYL